MMQKGETMTRILPIQPTRKNYKQITGDSNPKMAKTEKKIAGVISTIWHGAPAELSGHEMCPWRDGCEHTCLHTAGAPHFMHVKSMGRIRRSLMLVEDRAMWQEQYLHDLCIQQARADEKGFLAVHRPNGTTDRKWEKVKFRDYGNRTMFELMPDMQFMDYTKAPYRLRPTEKLPPNYHMTFSLSIAKLNEKWARESLEKGRSVAVAFAVRRGQPLPETFWGVPVVDGDEHDMRFMDPEGCIVGLRAKGSAIGSTTGFVRNPHTGERMLSVRDWVEVDGRYATFQFYRRSA